MKRNLLLAVCLLAGLCGCSGSSSGILLETYNYQVPVLRNKQVNPVMSLCLTGAVGQHLKSLDFSITGAAALQSIQLFLDTHDGEFDETQPYSSALELRDLSKIRVAGDLLLKDTTYLWVSLTMKPQASLRDTFSIECVRARLGGESLRSPRRVTATSPKDRVLLRTGLALRQAGQDGVHTSRIPGLVTTTKGTLIALFDARRQVTRDLQGDIDIAIHRSTDGGNTWGPMQVVLDMGEWGGLPQKYNGVSDACILSDTLTGDLYVAGLWMYGMLDQEGRFVEGLNGESDQWEHQWRNKGSQPGFSPKQTAQYLIAKSTDDGLTWSKPMNITKECKQEDWWLFCPAPGNGITMRDGTLVIPSQGRNAKGVPFSCILYSKDSGQSWQVSSPAYASSSNECSVVQLADGGLMLNMRCHDNRGKGEGEGNGRAIAVTHDMGRTWEEHPASRHALIEPICMASMYRHKQDLFFLNPSSTVNRDHITLKRSMDDGATWPAKDWMLLDELYGWGYSCITAIDQNTLGVLYEGSGAHMVFQVIPVDEVK